MPVAQLCRRLRPRAQGFERRNHDHCRSRTISLRRRLWSGECGGTEYAAKRCCGWRGQRVRGGFRQRRAFRRWERPRPSLVRYGEQPHPRLDAESRAAISPGGIVPNDGSNSIIQAGSWISIYGSYLANGTYLWNGDFPMSLGGTSVTIDGKPAYLWFVSPTQINAQAPDDADNGDRLPWRSRPRLERRAGR